MPTQQIAVRLSPEQMRFLDLLVDGGAFASRADAVRAGIDALAERERRRRDDELIVEGYRRVPPTAAETADAVSSLRQAIAEEPW